MADTRVRRIVLARAGDREPLDAGRPQVRRYRLARLEHVAEEGLRPRPVARDRGPESRREGA